MNLLVSHIHLLPAISVFHVSRYPLPYDGQITGASLACRSRQETETKARICCGELDSREIELVKGAPDARLDAAQEKRLMDVEAQLWQGSGEFMEKSQVFDDFWLYFVKKILNMFLIRQKYPNMLIFAADFWFLLPILDGCRFFDADEFNELF
ncbi:hypothetical protein E3N88_13858 [Mikania micrantha]|uniref:Uncharacterized protein n=1 Tax=Mikania micrantha TaxID=192012 RepID=A0A5N6P103_9ASTR|nr:hypothetical protein E3N88_13858 [Mikania micrantha]